MAKAKNPALEEWKEEVQSLSIERRNELVVELYKEIEELSEAKKEDPDIKSLKEQLKEASKTYSERISFLKQKIKILLQSDKS